MRPIRLRLKGFTSFKEPADVPFGSLDRFAVCGPTGAGKSSLLDALTFALFADAPRCGSGPLANLISLGRKSFSVSLDFAVGAQTFRVTRVRRRAGSGSDQLEKVVGSDKAELAASGERAVTEYVEKLLGLNYGHFTQAVFLPQGKFAEFLKAKPGERRRVLNELLRLLVFERMQDSAGKEREAQAEKKAQTDRRLEEGFQGITEAARADLERQREEQLGKAAAAEAQLSALRERRDAAARDWAWTTEWETKQAERGDWSARQSEIDAARGDLEAANRAAAVVPLLEQSDAAQEEAGRRQTALRRAEAERDRRVDEHRVASEAIEQAVGRAASYPPCECA
jgi:exonuclease SbcC